MIKKFFSMASALILLLLFAISSAVATFIESFYDTQTAWALVYSTFWFGLIQVYLCANLIYNIQEYKLFSLKKLPSLMFHISFVFILIGAGLTRYFGFEGEMYLKENQSSNSFNTFQSYIHFGVGTNENNFLTSIPKYISKLDNNDFNLNLKFGDKQANLKYKKFIPNAVYYWEKNNDGKAILEVLFSNDQNQRQITLTQGESVEIADMSFCFDSEPKQEKFIKITLENEEFFIQTNQDIDFLNMINMNKTKLNKNSKQKFENLGFYSLHKINFAPKTMLSHAKKSVKSGNNGKDAILADLITDSSRDEIVIFRDEEATLMEKNGNVFFAAWSPTKINLPFEIKLNKFVFERYPGSKSPKNYSSFVSIIDQNNSFDYHIFMNHVLDYKGYRFFQHSYDMQETGSVLSVNYDPGKIPTYIGYFLLTIGLLLNILNPNSRFRKLLSYFNKNTLILAFALIFINQLHADPHINKEYAKELASLIVQDSNGRMKPFDTLSHEILTKIYGSTNIFNLNSNEALFSMHINSDFWANANIIKIKDKQIKKILNMPPNQKYTSFSNFFDKNTEYKLLKHSELANRKSPSTRSLFDKEIVKIDEKINILYSVFMGDFFRVIPKQNDKNNAWHSPTSVIMGFKGDERKQSLEILQNIFDTAIEAQNNNDWSMATKSLKDLKNYQFTHGSSVIPSKNHIYFEILFNKYNVFKNLIFVYLLIGLILFVNVFVKMSKKSKICDFIFKSAYYINIAAFILQSIWMGIRWYISGHAPWSNSYESMVYIAWALILCGIIFANKSQISLSLTNILAGITLFTAHLSWLDPQITTLVPVLQSYWLTIHVSVITASYGFLGLCCMLGLFTLILFSMQGKNENLELSKNILETTKINEISMILGLSLLIIGNFLGGVWANESWGRYWGWDSKETWSLISILTYTAVLHERFVKKLNSQIIFAISSLFAYWAIIMTYFGVNFYLTGMHSYASGEPVQTPEFVIIVIIIFVFVSVLGIIRGKKYSKPL